MEKILKLENQPIETFQGISFVQSIILAHKNVKNELYNSYINLVCNNSNDIDNIIITFLDVLWDDFRLAGLVNMDMYNLTNINKSNITSFLKERIDHNDYIMIFNIDEFYLPYSKAYQQFHYIHDTYVFGYDNDEFMVMAYKDNKLQRIRVNQNQIETGIYKLWLKDKDIGICTLQVNKYANKEIDLCKIISSLSYYLESKDNNGNYSNDDIFGISIYKILEKYIIERKGKVKVDLRLFRMLWEHKKVMKHRIEKIIKIFNLDNVYFDKIDNIERMSYTLFNMMIKYSFTYDTDILQRAISLLIKIEHEEKLFIEIIINVLINCTK